jgi:hypothetical protein
MKWSFGPKGDATLYQNTRRGEKIHYLGEVVLGKDTESGKTAFISVHHAASLNEAGRNWETRFCLLPQPEKVLLHQIMSCIHAANRLD